MKLDQLNKSANRSAKRIGRGYGSKKGGHTVGRGQKGQRSRNSIPIWFEGGQLPQIRRFPFQRGKNRFGSLKGNVIILNLSDLNIFPDKTIVDYKAIVDAGLVKANELRQAGVKILGNGKLEKALTVVLPVSTQAQVKIEKSGGKVDRGQAE